MSKNKIMLMWAIMATVAYGTENVKLDKTVVYSTTGFATDMRKVAATPTIITAKEIEEKNYKTIEEIFKDTPSVTVVNNISFGPIVDMRGQGSKIARRNVQVLVDGVQMNSLETSHVPTPINIVPVSTVERIEIIPGGGSVLYGSGTAGGVINIITKDDVKKTRRGSVGYRRSSYEGNNYDVVVGESFGKIDVDLAYSNSDAYGYRDKEKKNDEFIEGKIKYNISENQDIEFTAKRYDKKKFYSHFYKGYLTKAEVEEDRKQAKGEYKKLKTKKEEQSLNYNLKLGENLAFNVVGFHQETKIRSMSLDKKGDPSIFDDEKRGIKPKLKYFYGEGSHKGSSVTMGIDYLDNDAVRIGSKSSADFNKTTFGTFVMNNFKYNKFELNQGIRFEKSDYKIDRRSKKNSNGDIKKDTSEKNFALELSGSYLYSNTGKVYTRVEQGFTSPPPTLLTDKTKAGYVLNDIGSETYRSIEVGASDYLFDNTIANISAFYTLTDDEIYTYNYRGKFIRNYNIDETERYGVEVSLKHDLGKLTLTESYNYVQAKVKKGIEKKCDKKGKPIDGVDLAGRYIANVPNHKFKVGAKYEFTDRFNVNGDVVYTSKYYVEEDNTGGKVNGYTVANVRANYALENGLEVYAGINNLFNKKYYEDVDYNKGEYGYIPAAERNYYAGFRYTF